jgi:L-alanine-DL-glutamate epimerase-like enolase superfamily enzyme
MAAPRRVDVGGGAILFGGDDAPGIVDLHLTGGLAHPPGPGALTAAIGVLDLTLKDLHAGGLSATVDRLHIGPIDRIEVSFDGFRPTALTAALHRVTATNLALVLGGATP